ncbi:hypothetical protein Hanom_Chr10g00907331 [Helianthus anomalus]
MSKLQVLSFMFTSNCRHCPFGQKCTGGVLRLNLSKSCTFCPLGQTWLEISVNSCHVQSVADPEIFSRGVTFLNVPINIKKNLGRFDGSGWVRSIT